MPVRRRAPARLRKRKGNRRGRIPRGLKAPRAQLKSYNFTYNLTPQTWYAALGGSEPVLSSGRQLIGNTVSSSGFWGAVTPSNDTGSMPGYSDITMSMAHQILDSSGAIIASSMFDAYKINKVTAEVEYVGNLASGFAGIIPSFYLYWDQDDTSPPANISVQLAKTGVRRWQPTASNLKTRFSYVPIPRASAGNGGTASFNPMVPKGAQWTNCQYTSLLHNAFKMYVSNFYAPMQSATQGHMFKVSFKYNISFRSPTYTN